MDKQEYKLRAEEIKSLIAKRDFFGAVKIADEIDWTRVLTCTFCIYYNDYRVLLIIVARSHICYINVIQ